MDEPLFSTPTTALGQVPVAETDPVAQVLIDHPVPHLARTFDYAVPASLAEAVRPGVRVRVKFAGKLRDGFVLARTATSDHVGPLAVIERVTSPITVLSPDLLELCEAVATRYAGTLPDVLRLAIPPRHARAEKAVLRALEHADEEGPVGAEAADKAAAGKDAARTETDAAGTETDAADTETADTAPESGTDSVLAALGAWVAESGDEDHGTAPAGSDRARLALTLTPGRLPGLGWITAGLEAAQAALAQGRSVLWLVPDHREIAVLSAALRAEIDRGRLTEFTELHADQSPEQRWTAWLTGLLGGTRLLIGTRAAAFAPMVDLGLIICTDDADQSYLDQHAPYPHAREVCLLRSNLEDTGLLFVAFDRSAEVERLVEIGWLSDVSPAANARRAGSPRVLVPDEERDPYAWQRIPSRAWEIMRQALRPRGDETAGPVLVQVPRAGYYPVFACARCQETARCPVCESPLSTQSEVGPFACRTCGYHSETFTCGRCRSHEVRSIVRGRTRTVEELRRALPGVEIVESGGEDIPIAVDFAPRVVVATTGAEPYAIGGYAAGILLDSLWPGPWMRASDEGVRRRMRAASLVRSRTDGGVVYLGDTDEVIRTALTTFDPAVTMARALHDRRELGFPPYRRIVELAGAGTDIDAVLADVDVLEELIRDDDEDGQRVVAAYPIAAGPAVGARLAEITAARSAKKLPQVRVRIDDPRSL
ncbi:MULTISPECIES: primosomal protein N' family DNA-binding protein [Brevibacterium]|uniref:Primosomal protein N n=4 Tax=Brevibacterium casei TaxID=33889 RepID=K9APM0_9MICO|nr:primosomal protein N' [Brevibacterium casei]EKU47941.1 primosomal protein N' [Brevibacterium casei S18]KZE18178.1 primosomal protein N' [Brevibacterium casei]MCT1446001.1 primosomal protein N' [Brevibacterium casei]MCT1549089.1 primosomal protein N' [Brevibacterium casei]MCT1559334.1 primosomal protein N' [Brevibacterium casei]